MPTNEELLAHYDKHGYDVPFPSQGSGNTQSLEQDPLLAHYETHGYDVPFDQAPPLQAPAPLDLQQPQGMMSAMGGAPAPMVPPQPQQPQYKDIRDPSAQLSSALPEGTSPYGLDVMKTAFMDMFTNTPQGRLDNLKGLFKDNFLGQETDDNGNVLVKIRKGDETEKFYLDAPNEDLMAVVADSPDFIFEAMKFYYGSKGMGAIGGKMGIGPSLSKIGTSIREGLKGGIVEGATTGLTTGDTGATLQDAGVEAGSSILMDTAIGGLGLVGKTARKIPFVGEKISNAQGAMGKWLLGSMGGNKPLGETLGVMSDTKSTRDKLRKAIEPRKDSKQRVSNFAEQIIRDSDDIPLDTRKELLRDIRGTKSEYIVGTSMLQQTNKVVKGMKDEVLEDMRSMGFDDKVLQDMKGMSDILFLDHAQRHGFLPKNSKLSEDISLLRGYLDNPEFAELKPSDILDGRWKDANAWFKDNGVSIDERDTHIYIQSQLMKRNPKTLKEYLDTQNEIADELIKKVHKSGISGDRAQKALTNIGRAKINVDSIMPKDSDALRQIKQLFSDSPIATGLAGGLAFGDVTGGVATGGFALLMKTMAKENPKGLVDKLSRLAYLQRASIDSAKTNKGFYRPSIVGGMSPEQLITAKRYLKTREVKDLMGYLGHNIRRQVMEPDMKAIVDTADLTLPNQEDMQNPKEIPLSSGNQQQMLDNKQLPDNLTEEFIKQQEDPAMRMYLYRNLLRRRSEEEALQSSGNQQQIPQESFGYIPQELKDTPEMSALIKEYNRLDVEGAVLSKLTPILDEMERLQDMWERKHGSNVVVPNEDDTVPMPSANQGFTVPMPSANQYEKPKKTFF